MTPGEIRVMSDPLKRESIARAEMEALSQRIEAYSAVRSQALQELHRQFGSWRAVAEQLGMSVAAVYKAAGR